jgi:hypothetical protein
MLCNWRNALCKNSVPADLLGALNASAILIGDGLDVVVVGAANGGKFHEEIMAYYKYAHFLEQQDGPEYDNVYEAGAAAPFSGIYHCEACGSSVTAVFSVPLPAQDHHLHAPQQGGFDGDWSLNRIIVRDFTRLHLHRRRLKRQTAGASSSLSWRTRIREPKTFPSGS